MEQLLQPIALIPIIITLLALAVGICMPRISAALDRRRKRRAIYEVIWKKSARLKPKQVMPFRSDAKQGFKKYYYRRDNYHQILEQQFKDKDNILIVGDPLAGKSRMVLQFLKSLKRCAVIILKLMPVDTRDFKIPRRLAFWRRRVLLLNDINKYLNEQNFVYLLKQFFDKDVIIVATCRTGSELKLAKAKLEGDFTNIFGKPVEIAKESREVGVHVAKEAGVELPDRFDGNLGSIFVRLDTMRDRFAKCSREQTRILQTMKRLYEAGIYKGAEVFSAKRIKVAYGARYQPDLSDGEWGEAYAELVEQGFLKKDGDQISTEECYIQEVIKDEFDILNNLREMLDIFRDDPQASYHIGHRSLNIGKNDPPRAQFLQVAIQALRYALEIWTREDNPRAWAESQLGLAETHVELAEVDDKRSNCRRTISACGEALKVFSTDKYPYPYATTIAVRARAEIVLIMEDNTIESIKAACVSVEESLRLCKLLSISDYEQSLQRILSSLQDILQKRQRRQRQRRMTTLIKGKKINLRRGRA